MFSVGIVLHAEQALGGGFLGVGLWLRSSIGRDLGKNTEIKLLLTR